MSNHNELGLKCSDPDEAERFADMLLAYDEAVDRACPDDLPMFAEAANVAVLLRRLASELRGYRKAVTWGVDTVAEAYRLDAEKLREEIAKRDADDPVLRAIEAAQEDTRPLTDAEREDENKVVRTFIDGALGSARFALCRARVSARLLVAARKVVAAVNESPGHARRAAEHFIELEAELNDLSLRDVVPERIGQEDWHAGTGATPDIDVKSAVYWGTREARDEALGLASDAAGEVK